MGAPLQAFVFAARDAVDEAARAPDPRVLRLAARIAAAAADPFAFGADPAPAAAIAPARALRAMTAHKSFRTPLRRALAAASPGGAPLALASDFLDRLARRPASRVCVALTTEPAETVCAAALDLALCVLHRRFLSVVLKSERARLRQALGEEGMRLATQEASLLYTGLAELDRFETLDWASAGVEPAATRARLTGVGMIVFARFVDFCEPTLASLFEARARVRVARDGAFAERHCEQVLKLLRRRTPAWSAFIA